MKFAALAFALALASVTAAAAADPVEGVWKTEVDDGAYAYVTFAPCGAALCGVISRTFNKDGEYASKNQGKNIVWDMNADGDGYYSGGKIWQPSTDKVYRSKMEMSGSVLKVSGCVGPICKKQTWNRVN
jgi:uncharacterized protein (DUF2147 family)